MIQAAAPPAEVDPDSPKAEIGLISFSLRLDRAIVGNRIPEAERELWLRTYRENPADAELGIAYRWQRV